MKRDGIEVKGHIGTWYVIAEGTMKGGEPMFLVEHETFGDEAAHLIIDKDCNVVLEDVYNGFDDYEESLED